MSNRINNMSKEEVKAEAQKRMNNIMAHANELFDLIPSGITVEVNLPAAQPEIIVPNQPKQRRILLVTRPNAVVCLDHI
jgi:hypothetical protein